MATQSSTALMEQALKKWSADQALAFLSKSFHVNGNIDYLIACIEMLHLFSEDIPVFHAALWSIRRDLFTLGAQMPEKQLEKAIYKKLAPKYLKFVDQIVKKTELPSIDVIDDTPNRLMIMGGQFLKPPHSPTMCMMEFARLAKLSGVEHVEIFNVNELPSAALSSYHEGFIGTPAITVGAHNVSYMGAELDIYAAPEQGMSSQKIKDCLEHVESFKPDLILSVGDMNCIADMCAGFIPSLCWPTTQSIALSLAGVQYYRSEEVPDTQIDWKRLKKKPPVMIKQEFDLMTIDENRHTINRDVLRVEKDTFLFVVVGSRIEQELTVAFQKLLVKVLDANPKACVLIVGTDDFSRLTELKDHASQIRLLKFTTDLRSVLSVSDAFLNPPRQGGGNAAYWSMFEGLPILTLDNCDVQMTIKQGAAVQDLAALEKLAIGIMQDADLLKTYQDKSKARLASLKDDKQSGDNLKDNLEFTIGNFKQHIG
ncbi:glycosyltransferase family protein [Hirschia baltica]|uniref:Glycosyl transferase group 1 n=1 Tax=Hirschia baltica (strain ATCC 49814 / DSM 5838 / IFAM 1418) TaxID=582402 RepID=C6XMT7_HIRBI|nr:glycosyltransferase [Hirschia baltica]ACT60001.1 hypothetical protein Hbal_2321 [Hirschia baltica ATCC 49814]